MPASNYRPRVVLQFNEYDFRHRKVLEILRSNKRHMTDLVVNAILHFISCPEAESEFSKEHIRNIVREVIAEMQADGSLGSLHTGHSNSGAQVSPEDALELGDMMAAFRK